MKVKHVARGWGGGGSPLPKMREKERKEEYKRGRERRGRGGGNMSVDYLENSVERSHTLFQKCETGISHSIND